MIARRPSVGLRRTLNGIGGEMLTALLQAGAVHVPGEVDSQVGGGVDAGLAVGRCRAGEGWAVLR